ncbi:hypothetical protein RRG08_031467 [Elysia crispata]|uniref:Uncharacterized protein n=1 Tax=Elysia crispata TaxID=231223 RepID=A0AAE0ZMZ4_9GAST|nr:hypothetical protein RRG08_031467 [Elysia crispata]
MARTVQSRRTSREMREIGRARDRLTSLVAPLISPIGVNVPRNLRSAELEVGTPVVEDRHVVIIITAIYQPSVIGLCLLSSCLSVLHVYGRF